MIAVDSSALVAIVLGEPDAEQHARTMRADAVIMSAAALTESAIVVESQQGPEGVRDLRALVRIYDIEVVPVDDELAWVAHAAWRRFGKGRHPAALNYGDCFSYALAKTRMVPLLFKGTDFAQTDVMVATPS